MNLRKTMISLLAAGAVAITAVAPASAAMRVVTPSVQEPVQLAPIQVRDHLPTGNEVYARKGKRYWKGYRGYSNYRNGYLRYNDGFWYPRAAFGLGIIIAPQPRRIIRSVGNAHVNWCYNRYRSYRAYDNSYQPYGGPRRICYSPYN
jgi:BA14K-like protein